MEGGKERWIDQGTAVLAQERGGDLSQMLRKEGFLGECGDTTGKFRGLVTLPQSHTGHLQARLSGTQVPHL